MRRVARAPFSDLEVQTRCLRDAIRTQHADEEFKPQPSAPNQYAEAEQRDSEVQSRTMLYHAPQVRGRPDQGTGECQQEDVTRQCQDGEVQFLTRCKSASMSQQR